MDFNKELGNAIPEKVREVRIEGGSLEDLRKTMSEEAIKSLQAKALSAFEGVLPTGFSLFGRGNALEISWF